MWDKIRYMKDFLNYLSTETEFAHFLVCMRDICPLEVGLSRKEKSPKFLKSILVFL